MTDKETKMSSKAEVIANKAKVKAKPSNANKRKRRRKSRASELGSDKIQKTVLWERSIKSNRTAAMINEALKEDEHVIEDGLVDEPLIKKVMCLEIKRWKVVTQLTDKIVSRLSDKDLAIIVRGNNVEDDGHTRYLFRKLCEKHMIETGHVGVANSRQKKSVYYAAKKFKQTGRKTQTYLVNELASRLGGEYMLKAGADMTAREIVSDIIAEVNAIIEARVG
jgi:hypothetical protein